METSWFPLAPDISAMSDSLYAQRGGIEKEIFEFRNEQTPGSPPYLFILQENPKRDFGLVGMKGFDSDMITSSQSLVSFL